jgi:hypothetical protein
LTCEGVAFGIQAGPGEYLTARNLFDNELLVVTISRTALSIVTTYSNFKEQTCNGYYKIIHINREDMPFHPNILLFIFTGQLLEHAISKGMNPNTDGDPYYFGFIKFACVCQEDTVFGKYLLSALDAIEGKNARRRENWSPKLQKRTTMNNILLTQEGVQKTNM